MAEASVTLWASENRAGRKEVKQRSISNQKGIDVLCLNEITAPFISVPN